jgi:large subunit ribosomal protein L22
LPQQEFLEDIQALKKKHSLSNVVAQRNWKRNYHIIELLYYQIRKMEAVAKLKNYPTGPRKMRLLADVIRGMDVEQSLSILEYHPQHNAKPLAKLLRSAIANWEQKNEGKSAADADLVVKTIFVDGGRSIKRLRPAPQGRGHRIRKRSNHVTIIVDSKFND